MRRGRSSQLRPRSFSERGRFAFRFRPHAERRLGRGVVRTAFAFDPAIFAGPAVGSGPLNKASVQLTNRSAAKPRSTEHGRLRWLAERDLNAIHNT